MSNSGLADVWIESGLYGQSTVDGMLSGKKYNKAIRAHKLTYDSLMRILIPFFTTWLIESKSPSVYSLNLINFYIAEIRDDLKTKRDALPSFLKLSSLTGELFTDFEEFIEAQTATTKYWCRYLNLVEILLEFLFAERSDMNKLRNTAPKVYEEFIEGNFVVKRLSGNFNQLPVDQALEHINKSSKDAGGIVGLTKNSSMLDEWFLSYNVVGMMIDEFRSSLTSQINISSKNVECGNKRMKVDERSVQKLFSEFIRFNVFSKSDDRLLVISTNEVASDIVQTSLLDVNDIGEQALKKFSEHTGVKVVAGDKRKTFRKGQEFLQKILAAKEMGRHSNYADIFKHELTAYPMSLAPTGILSTPSNKSNLGNIIEKFTSSCKDLPPGNSGETFHVFDGMALIQGLGKPTNARTFGEYANILKAIVFKNKYNAGRIDFVLDHYEDFSINNCRRDKRGHKNDAIERAIESSNTLLPQQWHLFIHSIANKKQLTDFVANQLYEHSHNFEVKFVTSGGFFDVMQYKSNYEAESDLLTSSHEEADTRIILHILSAKMEGYTRCILDCKDTDVLLLLAHFKDILTLEIWMKVGTKETERFIAIHELKMDSSMTKCLPAFHALTGCDTTIQFVGMGKKACWKIFLSHHNLLSNVGMSDNLDEEDFKKMIKFVIRFYTINENIQCINDLRRILASSKPISKLPPTLDSLKQHCLRVHYQTKIWLNSTTPKPSLPDVSDCGWKIVDGKLLPILTTISILPEDTSALNTCNCKKVDRDLTGAELQRVNLINRDEITYLTRKHDIDNKKDCNEMVAAATRMEKKIAFFYNDISVGPEIPEEVLLVPVSSEGNEDYSLARVTITSQPTSTTSQATVSTTSQAIVSTNESDTSLATKLAFLHSNVQLVKPNEEIRAKKARIMKDSEVEEIIDSSWWVT
ncbi:unnamed protein product [Ceutorhynchus assimilis]|uniref:Uncharacterized protein n=1 Tax=Ceutorhynchus assimilis TaxID=467358 RepID=A0A9N9M9T0_9CUCU|nr:unnamed protein product [Ceutorhynchus assimilis]